VSPRRSRHRSVATTRPVPAGAEGPREQPTGTFDPVLSELLDLDGAVAAGRLYPRLQELRIAFAGIDDPIQHALVRNELVKKLTALGIGSPTSLADAVLDHNELPGSDTALPSPEASMPGPSIDAGDLDLPRATERAWKALEEANEPPFLFRRGGGTPSRLEGGSDQAPPTLEPLNQDRLRFHLARAAKWTVRTKRGTRPALPPLHVVRDMLARPDPPLPPLIRIVSAPVFATDGRLLDAPGYDRGAAIYYAPVRGRTVPVVEPTPGGDDVKRARTLLLEELLGDFPFSGEAEQAHALALLLLPFVRDLIDGLTPLHLLEKPAPGTGAGLLVQALLYPALGQPPAVMTAGRDDEEWRKRITAKLVSGSAVVWIDNIRGRLESASLAAALTASIWEDRVLGQTITARIPVRCVWTATANNAALSMDLARRTLRIRLDAKMDRPWERRPEQFRHPDLLGWAAEHRGELVWAALTLGRAWLCSGRPSGAPTLGGFEPWSHVMGGILEVAEVPGFLSNTQDFYEASDAEGAETRRLVAAWWAKFQDAEVGVKGLFDLAVSDQVAMTLSGKTDQAQRVQLGQRLAGLRDRRYTLTTGAGEVTVQVLRGGEAQRALLWRLCVIKDRVPGSVKTHPPSPDSSSTRQPGGQSGPAGSESVSIGEAFPGLAAASGGEALRVSPATPFTDAPGSDDGLEEVPL
jgi:putative DNA primase/helicase